MLGHHRVFLQKYTRQRACSSSSSGSSTGRRACRRGARSTHKQQGMCASDAASAAKSGVEGTCSAAQHRQQLLQHPLQHSAFGVARISNSNACNSSSSSGRGRRLSLHEIQQLLQCRPASEHAALLTAAIKATSSWQEAAALYSQHSGSFNHIHTAALISHLPKVLKMQQQLDGRQAASDLQQLLQDLSQVAEEVLPSCSGRELANIAHGFAALGFYNRRLMQLLLCRCVVTTLKPQELANLTWAVAKLNHEVHEGWTAEVLALSEQYMFNPELHDSQQQQQQQMLNPNLQDFPTQASHVSPALPSPCQEDDAASWDHNTQDSPPLGFSNHEVFKPQELVTLAWALATMQRNCLLSASRPLRSCCTRVDAAWLTRYCAAAAALLPQCKAADVAMGLWAAAVLGAGNIRRQWVSLLLQRAVEVMEDMQGRHAAMLLWAVNRIQQQQQYAGRNTTLQNSSSGCGGGGGSSGCGSVQHFADACFPRVLQLLLGGQDQQQQLQLVCVVLAAAAHLQHAPPAAAMHGMLQAAAIQLQQQSRNSWQNMQQQQQHSQTRAGSSSASSNAFWQQQQQQQVVRLHDVSSLLYALVRLQYRPSPQFMATAAQAVAAACWQQLLCWQRHKQQQQQQQCVQQQRYTQTPSVQPKEVAVLLWSMGKLYCQPPASVLRLLYKVTAARISSCSSRDIGMMFWGLARMRARPRHAWVQLMLSQFLLRLDDGIATAADVGHVVHALALLPGGRKLNRHLCERLTAAGQLQQLAAVAQQQLSECSPRELVQVIQGFARLGFRPDHEWISQHTSCCDQIGAEQFSVRELEALAAARAMLAQLPEQQQQQLLLSLQQQQHLLQHQRRVQQLATV